MQRRAQLLAGAWTIVIFGYALKGMRKRRALRGAGTGDADAAAARRASPLSRVLRLALAGKAEGVTLNSAALFANLSLRLVVNLIVQQQIGVLGGRAAAKDWTGLTQAQVEFLLWTIPASMLTALSVFFRSRLSFALRGKIAEEIHRRLATAGLANTVALLPDADERATADASVTAAAIADLAESLTKPLLEVALLTATLGRKMGWTYLFQCYTYFAFAGLATRSLLPSSAATAARVQQRESDYRSHHSRLREYAEEVDLITLSSGRTVELSLLRQSWEKLRKLALHRDVVKATSDTLDTYVLRYVGTVMALISMIPVVRDSNSSDVDPTQYLLTCLHLLVNVGIACRDFVGAVKRIAPAKGTASRVMDLLDAIEATKAPKQPATTLGTKGAILAVSNLDVVTPSGSVLVRGLSFDVPKRAHLLIRGPNGCGKSSLLRVLTGLWPRNPDSNVALPQNDLQILTSRPYLIPHLNLREQLLYPFTSQSLTRTDAQLRNALSWAGLAHLSDMLEENSFYGTLSSGQAQRLAVARLVLRIPKIVLMDEATTGVSRDFDLQFSKFAQENEITVVTIAHHDEEMPRYYSHCLTLDGRGGWEFSTL
eukprot:TRINITY_DN31586_c0_g1_i1.p1 TRINITY_DN31586_c0_g1~~TRINITY_DN31586_c0_g1_i1.p1  ORF type:complete len:606 (+),score=96.32 TRINITY_DN31586_c0_g1_i1:23-1819(+)